MTMLEPSHDLASAGPVLQGGDSECGDCAIDIGDAQPDIDWGALADSPILLVFVKATEGAKFTSPTFDAQLAGAQRAKKLVVPYHFIRPGPADPQVALFRRVTALAKNQAFALDWEGRASQTATPQVCEAIGTQLAAFAGRVPTGYWGIAGSTPAVPTTVMDGWDRWVPRYPQSAVSSFVDLSPAARQKQPAGALLWQYTCTGRVPGIRQAVDRSVFIARSLDDVRAWYATGARPAA